MLFSINLDGDKAEVLHHLMWDVQNQLWMIVSENIHAEGNETLAHTAQEGSFQLHISTELLGVTHPKWDAWA